MTIETEIAGSVVWCQKALRRNGAAHVDDATSPGVASTMADIDQLTLIYASTRGHTTMRGGFTAYRRMVDAYRASVNL